MPASVPDADDSLTLTVEDALATGNSVKVYYTKGTNVVKDKAGNELDSLAEASAISATEVVVEPTMTFTPADGASISIGSANFTVAFSDAVYATSTGTAFTNTTIDNIITLKSGHEDGAAVGFNATISGNTVTINPTNNLASGDAVFLSVSDGWYYGPNATKLQGSAETALVGYRMSGSGTYDYVFSGDTVLLADGLSDTNSDLHIASLGGWFSADCSSGTGTGYTNTSTDTNYVGSIITLKQNNASGTDIPFTATISDNVSNQNTGQNYITIDPASALSRDGVPRYRTVSILWCRPYLSLLSRQYQ